MTNAVRGLVTLELGGTTYRLEYTIDALCQLEDAAGRAAAEILMELVDLINARKSVRVGLQRTLFWGALREHHPELTLKAAGELWRVEGGAAIWAATQRAFVAAWPSGDTAADPAAEADPENPPKTQLEATAAPAGTGAPSASSGTVEAAAAPPSTGDRPPEASS